MHLKWLDYLCDPVNGEQLTVDAVSVDGDVVLEGELRSSARSYPIVRGIPRFAGYSQSTYVKSFSYQWRRWARVQFESENVGRPLAGHTTRMWERITRADSNMQNRVFADFGCGSGRFIEVVRRKRGKVIGLDLSAAVESARESFLDDPDVLICQADVLRPPIRSGALDGAFSIGVLHHTPEPFAGVRQMTNVVKSGGWVAVAVYGKGGFYDFPTVQLYRRAFQTLWPLLGHWPPLLYSYFAAYGIRPLLKIPMLGLALRAVFPVASLPDARWALLDTFDSVTPSYQSSHQSREVFDWCRAAGLVDIEPSDWGFTSYRGVRTSYRQLADASETRSDTDLIVLAEASGGLSH